MKPNDEVIYSISITGIESLVHQSAIVNALPSYIGSAKMGIMPVREDAHGVIEVPRLFTFWRGDAAEQAWQTTLSQVAHARGASIAIDVQPWTPATGYPQGDVDL